VSELAAQYWTAFAAAVLDESEIGAGIVMMVNGLNARLDGGGATAVRLADELSLFSLVAGG
jgi:hypothetical protein